MQQQVNQVSFGARILFKKPNTEVKPYFVVGGLRGSTKGDSLSVLNKTREANWLQKFMFGLSKYTKLPSGRGK